MKTFLVTTRIVVHTTLEVQANSEAEATQKFYEMPSEDILEYLGNRANRFSYDFDAEATSAYEKETLT